MELLILLLDILVLFCVKIDEKVVFCLPTPGRKTQLFPPHILTTWEEPFRDSLYSPKIGRKDIQGSEKAFLHV